MCLVPLMGISALAETSDLRYSTRVKLSITADETIKGAIGSYLRRELRSFTDVEIVEDKPVWIINVVALETINKAGHKTGVALSTIILRPFQNQYLSSYFEPSKKELGLHMTSGLSQAYGPYLHIGPEDDLEKICKSVVTRFDSQFLEDDRTFYQQLKELTRKQPTAGP